MPIPYQTRARNGTDTLPELWNCYKSVSSGPRSDSRTTTDTTDGL